MKLKKVFIIFLNIIALVFLFLDIMNIVSNKYLFFICLAFIFISTYYIVKKTKKEK
jgi:hypothetical protein